MVHAAPTSKIGPNRGARRKNTTHRLWLAMLVSNVLALFAAVLISKRVRSFSLPVNQEPVWMAVGYALMLVAAVITAFWADEVFFRGSFRKAHLSGKGLAHAEKSGDAEAISAALRPMHLIFPVLVLAGLALSYVAANAVSRGFFSNYDRIGAPALTVRRTEPAQAQARKDAVEALSMVQRPKVQLFLSRQLHHPDEETAAYAAWALGRLRNKNLRRMFSESLMRAAKSKKPMLAKEAQIALARMQHRAVAPLIEQRLEQGLLHLGDKLDPRLVWALGFTQQGSSIPLLAKALYHRDAQIRRVAAWALGQQKGPKNAERSLKVLQERLVSAPLPTRCAVVHAMGILGHERANLDIVRAWRDSSPEERGRYCEPESVRLRPDAGGQDHHKLLLTPMRNTVETFEVMTLFSMGAIRATQEEIRKPVLGMLEEILADPQAKPRSQDAARSLQSGIQGSK